MIIYLPKEEYIPGLEALRTNEPFCNMVEALGDVLKTGSHWLRAAPLLLKALSNWPGLSQQQRLAYQACARENVVPIFPLGDVTDELVLTGPIGPMTVQHPDSPTVWHRRHWSTVQSINDLQQTVLGGENRADALWYRWLARAWSARTNPQSSRPGAELVLRCHGLGGSTADKEAPAHLDAGSPILCIADSDKDHADAPDGLTARRLRQALEARSGDSLPWHLEVLQARFAENLVPEALAELVGREREWLEPMRRRGFFIGPASVPHPDLKWLHVGRHACETRLLEGVDMPTRILREAAVAAIRRADPECDAGSTCEVDMTGTRRCEALARRQEAQAAGKKAEWGDIPRGCRLVFSIGKLPADLSAALDKMGDTAAHWLASQLPAAGEEVWNVAQRAWSWGLRMQPRIPSNVGL